MRRYTIHVNGTEHVVDVEEVTTSSYRVEIDGVAADVRLTDHQALSQAMIAPGLEMGRAHVPAPQPSGTGPASPTPQPSGTGPSAAPTTTAAPAASVPETAGAAGAGDLTAPMPGVVLTVHVEPGTSVARGDVLVVLEAMKMKNELRARTGGVVATVPVSVGQQVAFGAPLVTFES